MNWIVAAACCVGALVVAGASNGNGKTRRYESGGYLVEVSGRAWKVISPADGAVVAQGASDTAGADADAWIAMNGAAPSDVVMNGLTVSDGDAKVSSFVDWIEFAAPLVPPPGTEWDEREWLDLLLAKALPGVRVMTVRGKRVSEVAAGLSKVAEKYRLGMLTTVRDPATDVAARAVGMSAPRDTNGRAARYSFNGSVWHLVVHPHPQSGWSWSVWKHFRTGDPAFSGHGPNIDDAEARALRWLEEYGS